MKVKKVNVIIEKIEVRRIKLQCPKCFTFLINPCSLNTIRFKCDCGQIIELIYPEREEK